MSSQSREKIALVVFAALIVLSLFGLGWYLLAGHSWNVAASNIDDTFGSMEGYTAIVYAGTEAPAEKDAGKKSATASANTSSGSSTKTLVTVDKTKDSYEEKGATVFSLDVEHPERYEEGTILKKGSHRFGVFSVSTPRPLKEIEKQVAYFSKYKVDFIVVITPAKSYVEHVKDIDIVVSTQDEDLFVMGETIDGTFFVDAPVRGSVGAILISPSNVVSAKVIEEL